MKSAANALTLHMPCPVPQGDDSPVLAAPNPFTSRQPPPSSSRKQRRAAPCIDLTVRLSPHVLHCMPCPCQQRHACIGSCACKPATLHRPPHLTQKPAFLLQVAPPFSTPGLDMACCQVSCCLSLYRCWTVTMRNQRKSSSEARWLPPPKRRGLRMPPLQPPPAPHQRPKCQRRQVRLC